jgi:hypothetical protein
MFGELIHSQITKNQSELNDGAAKSLAVPSKVAIALISINPMCKYALEMNPVCLIIEG